MKECKRKGLDGVKARNEGEKIVIYQADCAVGEEMMKFRGELGMICESHQNFTRNQNFLVLSAVVIFFVFQVSATVNLIKSSLFRSLVLEKLFIIISQVAWGNEKHLTNSAEMSTTINVASLVASGLGIKNNNLCRGSFFSLKRGGQKMKKKQLKMNNLEGKKLCPRKCPLTIKIDKKRELMNNERARLKKSQFYCCHLKWW